MTSPGSFLSTLSCDFFFVVVGIFSPSGMFVFYREVEDCCNTPSIKTSTVKRICNFKLLELFI